MSKGNIKIAGNGTINAGEYEEIKIMGNASSEGDVMAERIFIMGSAGFKGNIEVKTCVIYGDMSLAGSIKAEEVKIYGDFDLEGNCEVTALTVNGSSRMAGLITGDNVEVRGELRLTESSRFKVLKVYGGVITPADLSGEEINIEGKLDCRGLLNAEILCLHLSVHSYCKEIGASKITVEKPFYHFLWFSYGKKCSLTCETIEGDEIKLENIKAQVVRGNNVTLAKECEIGKLEYHESFHKGSECTVGEVTKVD